MYRVAFAALLAACSFHPVPLAGDAAGPGSDGQHSNGSGDATDGPGDADCVAWEFTPTNFEPCAIAPATAGLDVTTSITLDLSTQPMTTVTQGDTTQIAVIHLTSLTVEPGATLTIPEMPAVAGVVFAVEGDASIQGTIVALAGADDPKHCMGATGKNGANSGNPADGAGGGGGGAAGDDGGDGGDGAGAMKGAKGGKGAKLPGGAASLSPLRGGCAGGTGGLVQGGSETAAAPGHGGGALEISARGTITVAGLLDANGRGGQGAPGDHDGGAGGGAGGGILLEAPTVTIEVTGHVCADGGSGGEGGGSTVSGKDGTPGACTGTGYALTPTSGATYGGLGGHGSYSASPKGGAGGPGMDSVSNGAGGGGGGGIGWIRIHSPTPTTGGVITPMPLVD